MKAAPDALAIFKQFVPEAAAPYCVRLYDHFGFEFKIKKARLTKLGDFRFDPRSKKYTITVNNDLNPYGFLITYLHEVAHLITFEKHKNRVDPHGEEWKHNFRQICQPILHESYLPLPVLTTLSRYLSNPKAASCSDPSLYLLLKKYDQPNGTLLLQSLQPGTTFYFNQKAYRYLEKKRTRILCEAVITGRKYLISQLAEISIT